MIHNLVLVVVVVVVLWQRARYIVTRKLKDNERTRGGPLFTKTIRRRTCCFAYIRVAMLTVEISSTAGYAICSCQLHR